MTTVYRVQNSESRGPYQDAFDNTELKDMEFAHNSDRTGHPCPHYDPDINRPPKSEELCGFATIKQLLNWFSKAELFMMKDFGFKIIKLDGHITAQSQTQILFTPVCENKTVALSNSFDDIEF